MKFRQKSHAAKIILLCIALTVVDKGWIRQTHAFELGAVVITQEALYALTLACSMLWRACTNSNNSAVDRELQKAINHLADHAPAHETNTVVLTTSQATQSQAHKEHIKPIPIPQRISPATVKKVDNTEKAKAVVSHVTQEQITQITKKNTPWMR